VSLNRAYGSFLLFTYKLNYKCLHKYSDDRINWRVAVIPRFFWIPFSKGENPVIKARPMLPMQLSFREARGFDLITGCGSKDVRIVCLLAGIIAKEALCFV